MLRSMTGYAQIEHEEPPYTVRVTLKTVNHRFLDLHLRLGSEVEPLEAKIRGWVRKQVRRGHVDVNVQVESAQVPSLKVDREFVRSYVELFNGVRQEHGLAAEVDLMAIMRMPGVVRLEEPRGGAQDSRLAGAIEQAVARALEELDRMRAAEGKTLEQELRTRAQSVRALTGQVARAAEPVRGASFARLRERLQELLGEVPLDETRLAQEAAYLAERSDVSEEIARLGSHVEQFTQLLESESEVGKQLDFLLQEMTRESNTLLAKSPGVEAGGLELTQLGLTLKAEIERLREQVQNVE
ncbi:MAG: YicC family protein [Acidobacteria bacterium]|nr:YicC family protein [Acidobacteriota bacterium]